MPIKRDYPGNIEALVTRATVAAYNYGLISQFVEQGHMQQVNGLRWRDMIDGMVDVLIQTPNALFDPVDEVVGGLLKAQTILIVKRINEDSFGALDVAGRVQRAIDFIIFGDWSQAGGSNEIVGGPPGPELRQTLITMVSAYVDSLLEYSCAVLFGTAEQPGICAPGYAPDIIGEVPDDSFFGSS